MENTHRKTGTGFFPRMAVMNIRKNGKFYIPYMITCMFTIAMFYIINFITTNDGILKIHGGDILQGMMVMGSGVVSVFSFIFLFYTNSFLMKRRKREFGLYNILGMEKRHIGIIMTYETLFVAFVTFAVGIASGIIFSKLVLMLIEKMLHFDVRIQFAVSVPAILSTLILFGIIFALILFANLLSVRRANAITLLHGSNEGEKEPKTKILLTLIGIAALGTGYYMAIATKSGIEAITFFFVAVILVVIGTYCLFTAGSIAILKMLRKNKTYYYNPKHFTSVSSMIYRMKKNAVGLANICILSTMVLVTVSTTVSLYLGAEDTLKQMYPTDYNITLHYTAEDFETRETDLEEMLNQIHAVAAENNRVDSNYTTYAMDTIVMVQNGNTYDAAVHYYDQSMPHIYSLLTAAGYAELTGEQYVLQKNQVVEFAEGEQSADTFEMLGNSYQVVDRLEAFPIKNGYGGAVENNHYLIVADEETLLAMDQAYHTALQDERANTLTQTVTFDFDGTDEQKIQCFRQMHQSWKTIECKQDVRSEFFAMYGGLLFVGIFLGLLFLVVTALIIYYKQITEGYEDKERFEIMQKVGMSKTEVRKSIRSQILTVFMLPILVAAIHVAVSFTMTRKMLSLLIMTNINLFGICTVITILAFIAVYILVYAITSRIYYRIVEQKD